MDEKSNNQTKELKEKKTNCKPSTNINVNHF